MKIKITTMGVGQSSLMYLSSLPRTAPGLLQKAYTLQVLSPDRLSYLPPFAQIHTRGQVREIQRKTC